MSDATVEWDVGIIWLTRRLRRPDRMLRERVRAVRSRDGEEKDSGSSSMLDSIGVFENGCAGLDEVPVLLALAAAALLVVGLAIVGPPVFAVTIGLIEIIIVIAVAIAGLAGRVLFGQPWEVVARRNNHPTSETAFTWRVVGYRRAREVMTEVDTSLRLGIDPAAIAPAHRDDSPPAALARVPGMYHRPEFRILGRLYGVIFGIAIITAVVLAVIAVD